MRIYTIIAGDTLGKIAEKEMDSPGSCELLALHNRNVGLLFEDDELFVGSTLEIPEYDTKDQNASVFQEDEP